MSLIETIYTKTISSHLKVQSAPQAHWPPDPHSFPGAREAQRPQGPPRGPGCLLGLDCRPPHSVHWARGFLRARGSPDLHWAPDFRLAPGARWGLEVHLARVVLSHTIIGINKI